MRERPAVGPDRVVQPDGDEGPGDRAVLQSAIRPPIGVTGRRSSRRSGARTATCGPTSTPSAASTGSRGLSYGDLGPEFIAESPYLNLYSFPAEADYARDRPLGPTWHRLDSTVRAADATWELPGAPARTRDGALIYLSLGSLGSADVALMQRLVDLLGDDGAPRHRVQGPARRRDHAARQPDGRGVPAAARDPAAGGPRDHARRQQHRHRGVPPRQADDRAAAVLGPGRQRPAGRRDGVRAAALDVRVP